MLNGQSLPIFMLYCPLLVSYLNGLPFIHKFTRDRHLSKQMLVFHLQTLDDFLNLK